MMYWGMIRCATLKNLSDTDLKDSEYRCRQNKKRAVAKMTAGFSAALLGVLVMPLLPVLPLLLVAGGVYHGWRAIKDCIENTEGVKAHQKEALRRVLSPSPPPPPEAAPATPPPAAKPVFNSEAAIVLGADIKAMKRIRIAAAEQPKIS